MATDLEACHESNRYEGFFIQYAITSVIILFQLLLFGRTLYQEWTNRRDPEFQRVKLQLRILYIALQTIGLLFTVNEFIRFVIAPSLNLHSASFCTFIASPARPLFVIYYTVYIYTILLRLFMTFHRSYLALKKSTFIILALFAIIPNVAVVILWFVWNDLEFCLREWIPRDVAGENMDKPWLLCSLVSNPKENALVLMLVACVTIFNIAFTSIFCIKLNRLLSHTQNRHHEHDPVKAEFRALLIKICILTVVSASSCLLSWFFWALFRVWQVIDDIFLYIDFFINCLSIGLMFSYNDKYYKRLCKCCISLCWKWYGEEEPVARESNTQIRLHTYSPSEACIKSAPTLQSISSIGRGTTDFSD